MELYEEIVTKILTESISEILEIKRIDLEKLVQTESYKALCKIKAIIENDKLEDDECFTKIEEIVQVFESIGSDGGNRHDFG